MTTTRRPCIGVFDSGFGGLTVLKELIALAPEADYIYFGDTARLPYGSKSAETVARYAIGAAQYLEQHGAQMLVIACNTATALALDQITQASSVPVVGVVEPGAARAAAASQVRRVVVIGTEATVSSHAYAKALQAHGVEATEKACPCSCRWWKKDGRNIRLPNRWPGSISTRRSPENSSPRTSWCWVAHTILC